MPYLSNAAVNRLNAHYGLHMLAWHLGGNFLPVFLMSRGFSAPAVLGCIALILVLRFLLRPIILVIAPRFGLRITLLLGCAVFGLQYLLLAFVREADSIFFAYCLVYALADIFYWTSYHAVFAVAGDTGHRGKQVGVREAVTTAMAIFAPLVGGLMLDKVGPHAAFNLAAICEFAAMLPLLKVPVLPVARKCPETRSRLRGRASSCS